ncbi:MAG: trypsin-like peptidase domain-containing protein [Bacteroidetes bacterium]|nr:trypsin-like peptidase domain-containing protein [Bacteroidota bacterium]
MKRLLIFLLLLIPSLSHAQSLGPERVKKLKESVVRILVEGQASGTGFLVTSDGWLLTCWHVIEPACIRDSVTHEIIKIKKIEVEDVNGKRYLTAYMTDMIKKGVGMAKAVTFDYCPLKIVDTTRKFSYLRIGDFNDVQEGERVYTCGYPLGIRQQFISTGILSTKWQDTISRLVNNVPTPIAFRDLAWLDLTMNKGNSGGPIIKWGDTPDKDEVIGIGTFVLNPYAANADYLAAVSDKLIKSGYDSRAAGYNIASIVSFFSKAITNSSIGVSGCISINHFKGDAQGK